MSTVIWPPAGWAIVRQEGDTIFIEEIPNWDEALTEDFGLECF